MDGYQELDIVEMKPAYCRAIFRWLLENHSDDWITVTNTGKYCPEKYFVTNEVYFLLKLKFGLK